MAIPQYYNNPQAYMGFVGFLRLQSGINNNSPLTVRATTADIALSQEVTTEDVIDSRFDRTVYRLGPKIVEGSVVFPAVYDAQSGANAVDALYRYAVVRTATGLLNDFNLDVKYAEDSIPNAASFTYQGCIANTFQFAVTQQELVNITVDMIGIDRVPEQPGWTPPSAAELTNTRIITWNDARIEIREGSRGGFENGYIGGQFMRSFEVNINNNAERFYTLNKALFPQAIAPTKRDVEGNIVLMGRHQDLANLALSNENYCAEDTEIAFGFVSQGTQEACNTAFGVVLPNVVFQIEEIGLTVDLLETTVSWRSLPAAGTGISDPLISSLDTGVTFNY